MAPPSSPALRFLIWAPAAALSPFPGYIIFPAKVTATDISEQALSVAPLCFITGWQTGLLSPRGSYSALPAGQSYHVSRSNPISPALSSNFLMGPLRATRLRRWRRWPVLLLPHHRKCRASMKKPGLWPRNGPGPRKR